MWSILYERCSDRISPIDPTVTNQRYSLKFLTFRFSVLSNFKASRGRLFLWTAFIVWLKCVLWARQIIIFVKIWRCCIRHPIFTVGWFFYWICVCALFQWYFQPYCFIIISRPILFMISYSSTGRSSCCSRWWCICCSGLTWALWDKRRCMIWWKFWWFVFWSWC